MKLEKIRSSLVNAYNSEFTHVVARSFVVMSILVGIALLLTYFFPLH